MKTNTEKQQGVSGLLTFLFTVAAVITASFAQAQDAQGNDTPGENETEINHAANVSFLAKATPLSGFINSNYMELKPALQGNKLYFSRSHHPKNTAGTNDREDIWFSEYNPSSGVWSEAERLPGTLNNEGPNFVTGVSVTGDTIMLGNQYLKSGRMRAGLSYSVNTNGTWSAPKTIRVQDEYNFSDHANYYVSLANGVIISAIEREHTEGSRDLYVSFWDGKGEASAPVNMGGIINSEFEESSPYLACDGKTLYFASKGHNGYGGYDIYRSVRLDDTWTNWSVPENLGPAVNDAKDDEFFVISHCKKFAFFSRRVDENNVDLFQIAMADLFNGEANFR